MAISANTQAALNEITETVNAGNEVYPYLFSHCHGRAAVSAAIRIAKKQNIIEVAGKDGVGNSFYVAAAKPNTASPWFVAA